LILLVSFTFAAFILGVAREDSPHRKELRFLRKVGSLFLLLIIAVVLVSNARRWANLPQWWFSSEQILFRRILSHQRVIPSLVKALAVNIINPALVYLSFSFIPESLMNGLRNWLKRRFAWANRHLQKINGGGSRFNNSYVSFLISSEKRKEVILRTISSYKYEYLALFLFSLVPYIGAAVVFTGKALEVRFELIPIWLGKIVKIMALSTIAYFAYFI